MNPEISKNPARKYTLLGHPVSHSLSPFIHNTSFRLLGIDASYDLHDTSEGLEKTIETLIKENYSGWNVTMPDKTAMCGMCDELSEASRIAGAVNTVIRRDGRLFGTTTDGDGFLYAVSRMGLSLKDRKLTLLGGGGAASSILIGASFGGAKEISVFCRSLSSRNRMEETAQSIRRYRDTAISFFDFQDEDILKREISGSLLLANATSAGMAPDTDRTPVPASCLSARTAVFDAIYSPKETLLLQNARKTGCRTANGLPMLVGQAGASFKLWTGLEMPAEIIMEKLSS